MLTSTEENFAVSLTDTCKSHREWLSTVRFGLKTLLGNQPLLIEIITREADRRLKDAPTHCVADEVRAIFAELGLRIVVIEAEASA